MIITEVDRRGDLIDKIQRHPLLDLTLQCLSDNPEIRPNITVIVAKNESHDLSTQTHNTKNKVEILRRIGYQDNIVRQFQEEKEREFDCFQCKNENDCKEIQQELQKKIARLTDKNYSSNESHLTVATTGIVKHIRFIIYTITYLCNIKLL